MLCLKLRRGYKINVYDKIVVENQRKNRKIWK